MQAAQAIIANARSVMLVADSTKLRRSAPVRIAHISQIQTFVTDAALPAGLANICHTRGIEVIEAMPKPAVDIDEGRLREPRLRNPCPQVRARSPSAVRNPSPAAPVLPSQLHFPVAFAFGCDLIQTESKIAKVNGRTPGKRLWIGFSTSRSSGAASTAAASRATRSAGEIPFSFVK